jgi:hypothetical protein
MLLLIALKTCKGEVFKRMNPSLNNRDHVVNMVAICQCLFAVKTNESTVSLGQHPAVMLPFALGELYMLSSLVSRGGRCYSLGSFGIVGFLY